MDLTWQETGSNLTLLGTENGSCGSVYNRMDTTVNYGFQIASYVIYGISLLICITVDGTICYVILTAHRMRSIRMNIFILNMVLGDLGSAFFVLVAITYIQQMAPNPNAYVTAKITAVYTFCQFYAIYSLVAMTLETIRFLSESPTTTLMVRIQAADSNFLRHKFTIILIMIIFIISILMAGLINFDSQVLDERTMLRTILIKTTVFGVVHAYIPITIMAIAFFYSSWFLTSRVKDLPRYLSGILPNRKRATRIVLLVTVAHVLCALPHATVVSYYVMALSSQQLDSTGCASNPGGLAAMLGNKRVLIWHRIGNYFLSLDSTLNGIIILSMSQHFQREFLKIYRSIKTRFRRRSTVSISTVPPCRMESLKLAFKIGEQGGIVHKNSKYHEFMDLA